MIYLLKNKNAIKKSKKYYKNIKYDALFLHVRTFYTNFNFFYF